MASSSGMKKRKQMILFAIGIILCFIPGLALGAVNPPHTAGANCDSCHFTYSSTPAWWTNPPADLDDTPKNRLCLNCHDDVTAPKKKTHSSLATGSTKYGDWTNECVTCHDPHMQRQIYNNEFPPALTGTITAVDGATNTFTLSITLPDRTGDSDPTNDYAGWTIVPNTKYKIVNYKIASNTANTVTVTTAINTARVSVGSTFGILYGKYIKELVYTPNSGPKYVKFYETENGPHSYINNDGLAGGQDSTPDGICQVCHTQTSRARNDGTGFGDGHPTDTSANCQACHDHATAGFAGIGGCTNCHGYPPVDDTTLVFKDKNGISVTSSSTGGNPGAGAHSAHISAGLDCVNCHTGGMLGGASQGNNNIDIGFFLGSNLGGTYDGQPNPPKSVFPLNAGGTTTITTGGSYGCSSVYCHSNVQGQTDGTGGPTVYGNPVWNNAASVQCGSCHNADGVQGDASLMSSGSHTTHVGAPLSKQCNECHNGAGSGTTVHVNNNINLAFQADPFSASGSYSQSPNTPGNGYGSCSSVYCHSTVQADGGSNAPTYANPTWGGTVACGDCHNADGVQGNATIMSTGSHTKHASTYGFACSTCHNGAGSGTAKHADKNIDIIIDTLYGASASYSQMPSNAPGNGYGACSTVYCHSNGKVNDTGSAVGQYASPNWGTDNGTLTCTSCHGTGGTSQVGEPDYANAGAGAVDANSHSPHISSLGASTISCNKCHSQTVDVAGAIDIAGGKHVNLTKDVVFSDGGTYTASTKTCSTTYCHGTGTPQWGGTVACGDCHAVNNTLASKHPTHYSTATNATVTDRTTAANNSTTTSYVFSCAVCHNGASHAGGAVGGGQTAEITFDGTVAGGGTYTAGGTTTTDPNGFDYTNGSCSTTYCHSNGNGGAPNVTPSWDSAVTLDCKSCHNYTAASGTPMASGSHTAHINDGTVMTNKSCEDCHNATTTDGTTIADKTKHVNHTKDVVLSSTWGGSYTSGACSTSYCHSNATSLTSPYGAPNTDLVWGTGTADCSSCHTGPPTGPDYTNGSPKANSHSTHTVTNSFNCIECHNSTVDNANNIATPANHLNQTYDVSGAEIGSYTSNTKTCNTVYCHGSTLTAGADTSPTWGTTVTCGDCHGASATTPPTAGSHERHAGSGTFGTGQQGLGLACTECHGTTAGGTGHVNKDVSWDLSAIDTAATYQGLNSGSTGAKAPSGTYGSCNNVYCHSDVQADGGNAGPQNYATPTWGGSVTCDSCHGTAGNGDGQPATGSHTAHVANNSFACSTCHNGAGDETTLHANQTINISIDTAYDAGAAAYSQGSHTPGSGGYGSCSSITCHGSGTPTWGGTVTCQDCHLGTGDVDDYTFSNFGSGMTMAQIDSTEWTSTGHGRTTGTYNVSGNAAAGLSCEYCHDDTVAHGTSTNPFRLANYNAGGNGWNDTCFACHQTGSTGYDPDGAGPLALKNSTLKIDKYHYGTKHGATNDGGSLCFDCHDPHGDSNIYMIHDNVTKDKADTYGTPSTTGAPVFTANTTGTDYAKSSAPFNGVCNVCHTTTNHYTSSSGDGHNSGTKCTTCHTHSGDTTVDGNAFSPQGGACNACHGYPPTIGDGKAYMDGVGESKGAHTQHVNHLLNLTGYTLDPQNDSFGDAKWQAICGTCHYGATHETNLAGQTDNSSARHIQVDPQYQFDPVNLPTYNGVPGTSSTVNLKSCSSVRCHFKDSPGWQDPATAGQ